jgi:hypothetical protein
MAKYTADEWASMIGEGIHTGFRKGSDHPKASEYWNLISKMPNELWNEVLDFCVDGLIYMKVIDVKEGGDGQTN